MITKNLGLPTIIVSRGVRKTKEALALSPGMAYNTYRHKDVNVKGIVANEIKVQNLEIAESVLRDFLPEEVDVFTIPRIESLAHPTMKEIVANLDGKVLFGEDFLDNQT